MEREQQGSEELDMVGPGESPATKKGDDFVKALAQEIRLYDARLSASNVDLDIAPKRWRAMGQFWKQMRLMTEKDRPEVAEALGIHRDQLTFFENGMTPTEDLPEDFLEHLAEALGHPELVALHRQIFEVGSKPSQNEGTEMILKK